MRSGKIAAAMTLPVLAGIAQAQDQDTIVVTASRVEQSLAQAPAAVTVISQETIERTPGDDIGDLLRNVPGVNVSQTSVRDINMTSRGSTNTLTNSQLVLLDGRSIYLDFFGIVLWDLLPVQSAEIRQIEVVRGPGSAVWGANAMSGVTNVITERPKDIVGTTVVVGTPWANVVHAAGDEDFAYKVSAGYFDQPAYDRPTGIVPGSDPVQNYADFQNKGTTQRRANARFDWGLEDGYFTLGVGGSATDGIIHTGIGPFDINNATDLTYVQADWYSGNAHIGASAQFLDGDATNLLTLSASGQPLGFRFINDTYNVDLSNSHSIGNRHQITYGGNIRMHDFELDIAPLASDKDEWGVFVQDEIELSDRFRWVVGVRYDDVEPLSDTVVTPRTSLLYSFSPNHTLRLSYNEAFRTPSAINNYLGISIFQPLAPGVGLTQDAVGDETLTEEKLKAWEIGYVGYLPDDISLSVSVYRNETEDAIDFFVANVYNSANLPTPGPTLPAALIPCFFFDRGTNPLCPAGGLGNWIPSDFSYRNIGKSIDKGLEFSVEQDLDEWYWWANMSWQDDPEVIGATLADVNRAPEWRINLGLGQELGKLFWNATVNYQDDAYWADVLYARAPTDAFTQVNASVGWRFDQNDMSVRLIIQNMFDETVQQHIFGDFIDRKVAAELRYTF